MPWRIPIQRKNVLTGVSLSATTVNVNDGAKLVAITVTTSDATGVDWTQSYVRLKDPNGTTPAAYWFPICAESSNTVYAPFTPEDPAGTWQIESLLEDKLDNRTTLYRTSERRLDSLSVPNITLQAIVDTDGDGVLDYADEAPNNANVKVTPKAIAASVSVNLLPGSGSSTGTGTLTSTLQDGSRQPTC